MAKIQQRIPSLDGLRGIAAVAVMFFHFDIFFLPHAQAFNVPFRGRTYLAVDLFFILSGFVLAHVYGEKLASNWRNQWKSFLVARFARIYPLFALTTLAVIATVSIFDSATLNIAAPETSGRYVSFSSESLAFQPFLLQQWAHNPSWNYPAWSISTEAEAYLIFVPLAGLCATGGYPRLMAACCVAIIAALAITHEGSLELHNGIPALIRTLPEFFLGALLCRAHLYDMRFARGWAALLAVLLLISGFLIRQDFIVVCGLASLVYYCVGATDVFTKLLNSYPAIALGNWSYSIYLWHAPVSYVIRAVFAECGHPVDELSLWYARLLTAATAAGVIALSALCYRYFETPMRRLITRTINGPSKSTEERLASA